MVRIAWNSNFERDNALGRIWNFYEFISFPWLNLFYKINLETLVIRRWFKFYLWTFDDSFVWLKKRELKEWILNPGESETFTDFLSEIESYLPKSRKKSRNFVYI